MINRRIAQITRALARENKHTAVGALGEALAAELFARHYQVQHNLPGQHKGDLTIVDPETGESFHIEVKTARQSKGKKWHFQLWKHKKTDHLNADYILLITVLKTGDAALFLVPESELRDVKHVSMRHPDHYSGKFTAFQQRGALTL